MNAGVHGRGARRERDGHPEARERRIRFRDSMIGFVLMTALVVVAAVGTFILLDPRAQAFWGLKLSELGALLRGALRF